MLKQFRELPILVPRVASESANLPRDNPTAAPTATFVLGHCYQNEVTGGWMCLPQEEPDRLFRTTPPRHIPRSPVDGNFPNTLHHRSPSLGRVS